MSEERSRTIPLRYVKLTPEKQARFLMHLAESGNVTFSADAVGVSRQAIYDLKERSETFADECELAMARYDSFLEEELNMRIFEGVKRPIYQRGELVGHENVKSDRLLEVALRSRMPEKYSERLAAKLEHSGSAGVLVVPGAMDMAAWMEKFGGAKPTHEDKPK
ncbi:MAG: hypothetical protein IOC56_08825 [Methylobacterium sp.]|nr:hypothetical protein [Methylobacterium sp.]MCA3608382.1 hypothetical protein [Methylobacterium sp.]MCA3617881.1 hypothetical protein [Methylobacterium sp.]MCA3621178.1 hypothetical protein [Methylobacterium sp.]